MHSEERSTSITKQLVFHTRFAVKRTVRSRLFNRRQTAARPKTASPVILMQIGCIMTRCKLLVSAGLCAVLVGCAAVVSAYTGEDLAKDAKVSLSEARVIALKAFPGKITDEELENEKGGSGLRYSFDIKNGGVTHEVGVDAKTGKLLENSAEGPHPD
jgi:hypothetical protein